MKFKPALLAFAAFTCVASTASAGVVVVSGTTTGGPTFNRPLEGLTGLSAVGTAVSYSTYAFSVSLAGTYTFTTTAANSSTFDTFTFLYGPTFNPASPLTNALIGNDDLFGVGEASGFAYALTAGTNYVYVTTGFANSDAGAFVTVIGGPGTITAAVPEPETALMMAVGLGALCLGRRCAVRTRQQHG